MSEFKGPSINKGRNGLGRRTPSTDSIFGLVLAGIVTAAYPALGEIEKLESLQDAEDLGFTASYDATNGILVHHHLKRFFYYNPNGTMYVMLVAQGTSMTDICDKENSHLKKLLTDEATNGEVKYAGVVLNPDMGSYVATYTDHVDSDVITAIPKADELVKDLYTKGIFIDGVMLEGRLSATTVITDLHNLRGLANENVAVCVAADPSIQSANVAFANYADVGSALGMVSVRKVSENIGSVDIANKPETFKGNETYPLTSTTKSYFLSAALSDGTAYNDLTDANKTSLKEKGYIYAGRFQGLDGIYFNDGHTCITAADDYAYIEDNRVWAKAARLARQALLPVIRGEVEIDPDTGFIVSSQLAYYQAKAETKLRAMSTDGEISGNPRVIIEPNQDVVGLGKISMQIQYVRRGILREIEADIGAINPAAN